MELRCTSCGSVEKFQFTEDKRWAICESCGVQFSLEQGKYMFSLDAEKAQRLPEMRKALIRSFRDKYYGDVDQITTDMLELLSNDFQATFYKHLSKKCQGFSDGYREFLFNLPIIPSPTEADEAFERALEYFELGDYESLKAFTNKAYSQNERDERRQRLEERYKLADIEYEEYMERPRDVFICFSLRDNQYANKVADMLKKYNISVFMCTRNIPRRIPHNSFMYNQRVEYAIANAKVFLWISSLNSSQSDEVANALRVARGVPNIVCVEFLVQQNQMRKRLIDTFLPGIKTINATRQGFDAYKMLKQWVCDELRNVQVKPVKPPERENKEVEASLRAQFKDLPATLLDEVILRVYRGDINWTQAAMELARKLAESPPSSSADPCAKNNDVPDTGVHNTRRAVPERQPLAPSQHKSAAQLPEDKHLTVISPLFPNS